MTSMLMSISSALEPVVELIIPGYIAGDVPSLYDIYVINIYDLILQDFTLKTADFGSMIN